MAKKFQTLKGFYDVLPERQRLCRFFEEKVLSVLDQYHYQEIGLPLVEPTGLFVESVGSHTDIVEKEMYSWEDHLNKDKLTLRPEGTAGCVRAVVENSLTYNGPVKLFYRGAMFRHENVQKGRQRQFHQVGVEAFGFEKPESDAEQILLLARLWKSLGLKNITLELNSIGDPNDRVIYRKKLIEYFEDNREVLDDDALRRLHENPLRILDSKNKEMQSMLNSAPKLIDYLSNEAKQHFENLCSILKSHNLAFKINTRLVRGLDYYNRTVFEWVSSDLGSQGTIAGGGRYDFLVERIGGNPTSACGFAIGIERIILLLEDLNKNNNNILPDVYIVNLGEMARPFAFFIAEKLRNEELKVSLNIEGSSFKSQMKKADKSGAKVALIIGDQEADNKKIQVKLIRKDGIQESVDEKTLSLYIKDKINFEK
jgi:histidyl-tRNA synthetase